MVKRMTSSKRSADVDPAETFFNLIIRQFAIRIAGEMVDDTNFRHACILRHFMRILKQEVMYARQNYPIPIPTK